MLSSLTISLHEAWLTQLLFFKDEFQCSARSFGCGYSLQKLPFQSDCNLFQEDMDEEAESGEGPGKPGFALLENRTFWQIPWKRFWALYMFLLTLTNHQDLPIQRNRYSGIMGLQNWTCWETNQQRGRPNKRCLSAARLLHPREVGHCLPPRPPRWKWHVPIPLLRLMTLLCTQRTCSSYILLIPIDIYYICILIIFCHFADTASVERSAGASNHRWKSGWTMDSSVKSMLFNSCRSSGNLGWLLVSRRSVKNLETAIARARFMASG